MSKKTLSKKTLTAKAIDGIIKKNLPRLRKSGVLTVRPGYEIARHQLTGKQAIVATVHTKKTELAKGEQLPDRIENVPVDVREATGHQRLRSHDPAAAALTQTYGRPENREPEWPFERELPSGRLLAPPDTTKQTAATKAVRQAASQRALARHATKKQIDYVPAKASLDSIPATATITAHVSPDAGLATLEAFLRKTRESLVVGMYDFTSGRILQTFENVLDGSKTLQMVLDNPPPNRTRDQTDTQTVEDLEQSLGNRAKIVRALVRSDSLVTAWIYPYAYHIKVIVRDGTAFWLSSGNLNNSNQPDLASPPHTEDRDWHVIIENEDLAQVFGAFLNQDFASALEWQKPMPADTHEAVADAFAKLAAESNPPPPPALAASTNGLVAPKVFKNARVTITPLLTPDNLVDDATKGEYLTSIMGLIESAQSTLYIQLQYIEASKESGDYDTLLQALADRVAAGVEVRLIESLEYGEKWAEKMKASGVDLTGNIYLQSNVHNKGFVVDSKVVVVSSQNFSPAGIRTNRDAGVIIEHADIAQYFEDVFVSDLKNKAEPFDPQAAAQQIKKGARAKKKPVAKPRPRVAARRKEKQPAKKTR